MRSMYFTAGLALVVACSDGTSPDPDPAPEGTPAMDIVAGDGQVDTVTHTLPQPLVVAVTRDSATGVVTVGPYRSSMAGDPMPGTLVNFRVTTNDCGEPFAGSALTDSLGLAADLWQLGTKARECRMEVRAVTAAGEPLVYDTFFATAEPGPADVILIDLPGMVWVGDSIALTDLIYATDEFGNPVPVTVVESSGFGIEDSWVRVDDEGVVGVEVASGGLVENAEAWSLYRLDRYEWESDVWCPGQGGRDSTTMEMVTDSVRYRSEQPDSTDVWFYYSGILIEHWPDHADTMDVGMSIDWFHQSPALLMDRPNSNSDAVLVPTPLIGTDPITYRSEDYCSRTLRVRP